MEVLGEPTRTDVLPELASVHWRPLADDRQLRRSGRIWTATTVAHTVPFIGAAAGLMALQPLSAPVALMAVAHAWVIPELYARRGANVVGRRPPAGEAAERRAMGLLGDLLDHDARDLFGRTGLVLEPGRLGVWLVGEAGALLVRDRGRRVHCYCVRVNEPNLPTGDRVAHLLLALRSDEAGFATVANLSFSGARWRIRRRVDAGMRPALDAAAAAFGQASRPARTPGPPLST
ncbi:MAG TPA: hypothetical protein VG165_01520 [Solirubrobacteraceae bacterium]|nr:hypothetical protein [Solirubrobacteraceae bacterium]